MSDNATPYQPPLHGRLGEVFLRIFAAIGLLAVLGFGAYLLALTTAERRAPAKVEAKGAKQVFAVAEVNPLHGTNLTEILIATDGSISPGDGSYSRASADARNVILLDKASGANRKLLPDNGRQIIERIYLPAAAGASSDENVQLVDAAGKKVDPPLAYYLLRVRAAEGKEDVLVGNLATGRQAYLLTGLDGVDKVWMQSATRVALLMRQGRKLHYRAIEVPDLKIVAARPVEID